MVSMANKNVKHKFSVLTAVDRAVNIMQEILDFIAIEKEQKYFLLRCAQEHRRICPGYKKQRLKTKFVE